MGLRKWLKLARIHTSNMTQAGMMLGAILAGEWNPLRLAPFALLGLLFHAWGFIENNIRDLPYDVKDQAKAHFALVAGEVSLREAEILDAVLLFGTAFLGGIMSRHSLIAPIFLLTAVIFGMTYNAKCKKSLLSPLYITASFASIPLFSYFCVSNQMSPSILLLTLYTVFLMSFEIAVLGYWKDFFSDKINLLKKLGCQGVSFTYKHKSEAEYRRFKPSRASKIFGWGLRAPNVVLAFAIWLVTRGDLNSLVLVVVFSAVLLFFVSLTLKPCDFNQTPVTRLCALVEITTYFLLIVSLQGTLAWTGVAFFIGYPIVWFICLNHLTWRTFIGPRV